MVIKNIVFIVAQYTTDFYCLSQLYEHKLLSNFNGLYIDICDEDELI